MGEFCPKVVDVVLRILANFNRNEKYNIIHFKAGLHLRV